MRVLIAEDDRSVAALLALLVGECGHEVAAVVTTGGLDVIRSYDTHQPDAVLMDVIMPKYNGFTVSHALLSKNPKVKIAFISGKIDADHPFVARSGASAFLQKPVRLPHVRQLLETLAAN